MNTLLILAHPNPGSFNHAIAAAAVDALRTLGHEVVFHDLYQERFDPVLPLKEIARDAPVDALVRRHCEDLAAAGGLVVVHPTWWGQAPAILKGWLDRVLRAGVAYEFREISPGVRSPVGLLKLRVGGVFNTANTPEEQELQVFGDPLDLIWRRSIFGVLQTPSVFRRRYRPMLTSTPEQRAAWLREVRQTVEQHFGAASEALPHAA